MDDAIKKLRIGRIAECVGKTIADADDTYYDGIIMRFTDGTWFSADPDAGCDCQDNYPELDTYSELPASDLHSVGIITDEQMEAEQARIVAARRERNQREIERLKAEIGE